MNSEEIKLGQTVVLLKIGPNSLEFANRGKEPTAGGFSGACTQDRE